MILLFFEFIVACLIVLAILYGIAIVKNGELDSFFKRPKKTGIMGFITVAYFGYWVYAIFSY